MDELDRQRIFLEFEELTKRITRAEETNKFLRKEVIDVRKRLLSLRVNMLILSIAVLALSVYLLVTSC